MLLILVSIAPQQGGEKPSCGSDLGIIENPDFKIP